MRLNWNPTRVGRATMPDHAGLISFDDNMQWMHLELRIPSFNAVYRSSETFCTFCMSCQLLIYHDVFVEKCQPAIPVACINGLVVFVNHFSRIHSADDPCIGTNCSTI